MHPRLLMALALASVLATAAVLGVAIASRDDDSAKLAPATGFEGAVLPKAFRAPDFELTDQDGEPISLDRYAGKPLFVTFLYANCEETCPLQAQIIKGAFDELGRDVPALVISVDPPNDTPRAAQRFLSKARMLGRLDWALGSRAELEPVWKGFAIAPQTDDVEHQARMMILDARGRPRVSFPVQEATPERLAHDYRKLEEG